MKKVFVGLSGGVDSSVSAALLQRDGFDVTGVFIKAWSPEWLPCTWRDERRDAMRVCARLGIPFVMLDLEKEYKRDVVDYMIAEYKAGRTPNPDVMCNKEIKFGSFFKWAMKQGADFVATGHYAQIKKDRNGGLALCESTDKDKDQSYFLWTLTTEQLNKVLFPVGGFVKSEVRKLAKTFNLPTAEKKDSQGLCFIGKINMKEFLKHYIPEKEGNVFNVEGKTIGTHEGASLYTLGERHGFTIAHSTPESKAMYVVSKDIKANTITVSDKEHKKGGVNNLNLSSLNWIGSHEPTIGKTYLIRIRYRQQPELCTFTSVSKTTATLSFKEPQEAISAGQSAVIYDGEKCMGGGIIESAH